jgi:hypothetical protein
MSVGSLNYNNSQANQAGKFRFQQRWHPLLITEVDRGVAGKQ